MCRQHRISMLVIPKENLMTLLRALPSAVVAIAISLTASVTYPQTLRTIAETGRITVGYRESSIPFSYLISPTKPVGFAVDITEAIVDEVRRRTGKPDLKVVYVLVTGQNRIPMLIDGSYDLECGSTTNTAARGKDVAFAISHFYAGTRLLTGTTSGVRGFEDLTGKTVSTVAGSTNEKVLRKHMEDRKLEMKVLAAKDYAETLQQLEAGQAAAVALDDILLYGLRANSGNPDALTVVGETLQVEPYGCMVRHGDAEFKRMVDATIAGLMQSGEFAKLYSKWFESPIPPKGINLRMPMSPQLQANLRERSDKPAQ
jgi:ABC-type amino acid transport substrate-binding protein